MRKMRDKNERECLRNKEKSEKTKEYGIETTPTIVIKGYSHNRRCSEHENT